MRTFKMVVTKTLQIKNDDTGAWEGVSLTTNENNLGEYLYTKTTPIVLGAAPLGFVPAAPPAPGAMAVLEGLMIYPDPGPSEDYDDLPPDPDPVINSLTVNKDYKFTVTATLKEWNGSSWVNAFKNNGTTVNQTIVKNFRTGSPVLVVVGAPMVGY